MFGNKRRELEAFALGNAMAGGRTRTEYVTKEVNINRQSTSDDAKLLKDLEDEAWKRVKEVVYWNLEPLGVTCADVHCLYDLADMKIRRRLLFEINGHKFDVQCDSEEDFRRDPSGLLRLVANAIAEELGNAVFAVELPPRT